MKTIYLPAFIVANSVNIWLKMTDSQVKTFSKKKFKTDSHVMTFSKKKCKTDSQVITMQN
jgi:hypothetical protein